MTRFIAIDPGERWVGVAALGLLRDRWTLEMGQIERRSAALAPVIDMLECWKPHVMAWERFQHRSQGHQTFNGGGTLQLIGAMRYQAERKSRRWREEHTANPETLKHYPIYKILQAWDRDVSSHVHSAWRVMMDTLQAVLPERMLQLHRFTNTAGIFPSIFKMEQSKFWQELEFIHIKSKFSQAVSLQIPEK